MHKSFHLNDSTNFTRPWFDWVYNLFGELVVKLDKEDKIHLRC